MEELTEGILERLDALALSLGTTVEHLWGVLVKQAYVVVIQNTFISIACFVILFIGVTTYKKINRKRIIKKEEYRKDNLEGSRHQWETVYDDSGEITGMIVMALISVIALGFAIASLSGIPTCVINPEYFALKKVLVLLQ